MATNKHAAIRYKALDKCFRNGGNNYFIEDLMEVCADAVYQHTGIPTSVSRRQIFDDIAFMESEAGFAIDLIRHKEGRKVFYRYSDLNFTISSQPLNQHEANQLKEALLTLSRFKGLPQFNWIEEITTRLEANFSLITPKKDLIQFEQNEYLIGIEYISDLYHAIANEKVIELEYQSFKQDEPVVHLVHAHLLKQYNNRWFLFAIVDGNDNLSIFSLDRIKGLKSVTNTFVESAIDFTELFEDVIGVSIPNDAEPQKIKLKIEKALAPYILSKPIHGSQKLIDKENLIFQIEVYINYEVIALFLSYGDGLEVLEPPVLREDFKQKLKNILTKYD